MSSASRKRNGSESIKSFSSSKAKKKKLFSQSSSIQSQAGFTKLSLVDIGAKIESLCNRVPAIPSDQFGLMNDSSPPVVSPSATSDSKPTAVEADNEKIQPAIVLDEESLRSWATQMQAALEEFNLLVCCVDSATYKWGTDRSGVANQNMGLLMSELSSSNDQIKVTVNESITDVLCPAVNLVIEKTVSMKDKDGNEVKVHHYTHKQVDPDFVKLCNQKLARTAPLVRQLVMSNFHKILETLKDFLKAQSNDSNDNCGFAY